MKFERIKPGMVLYDLHRERAGNTMMHRWGVWEVRVISVDVEGRTAEASWNGNRPQTYTEKELRELRVERPVMVGDNFLFKRPETRAEKKARLAAARQTQADPTRDTGVARLGKEG